MHASARALKTGFASLYQVSTSPTKSPQRLCSMDHSNATALFPLLHLYFENIPITNILYCSQYDSFAEICAFARLLPLQIPNFSKGVSGIYLIWKGGDSRVWKESRYIFALILDHVISITLLVDNLALAYHIFFSTLTNQAYKDFGFNILRLF